ncbi:hypothetical protein G7Z17_g1959 [Cylindrodendrum hubeiense]|uniref:Peptidase M20 domain-containing protein 2 n=1 Tax=Cylindrodendrum hubeiense TaxID=595255 RepID=A0A9P5LJL8_9HYPO|nr:hypothetical protein G7Z17_g1959 [Cylindrodendrum hubeiense]
MLTSLVDCARKVTAVAIDEANTGLATLNEAIHSHPELCYEETFAHATLCDYLESRGFKITRHAYGIDTAFEAEAGSGGRLVIICAEYDALPGMGHGCGHNLIATSSVAAAVGAARALKELGVAGRVRVLGTPAEEGGGGKVKLLEAGAFTKTEGDDGSVVAAAIMCHALPLHQLKDGWTGVAGFRTLASRRFQVEFFGKNAHAGQEPWNGVNALDAAVGAYMSVSMLRQQIRPDDRVQSVIEDGGKQPNIIPDYTRMNWGLRSLSIARVDSLYAQVKECINGAARAAGCTVNFIPSSPYIELRVNNTLCEEYIHEMGLLGEKIQFLEDQHSSAGTDMGNVSHAVPSLHGIFGIPTPRGVPVHHRDFATASATTEAHDAAIRAGKGLAMLCFKLLVDSDIAARAAADFVM